MTAAWPVLHVSLDSLDLGLSGRFAPVPVDICHEPDAADVADRAVEPGSHLSAASRVADERRVVAIGDAASRAIVRKHENARDRDRRPPERGASELRREANFGVLPSKRLFERAPFTLRLA